MAQDLPMSIPSFPFPEGNRPTDVEYEVTPVDGEPESVIAPVGEVARAATDPPCRFRYRFLWSGRAGAWSDEGVTWKPPA